MKHDKDNTNWIYILSVLLPIVANFINKNNLVAASIGIMIIGIFLLFFNTTKGAVYFFLMGLSFSDYTYESVYAADGEGASGLGGIYMASVGGSTLMVYWSLISLVVLLLRKGNIFFNTIRLSPFLKILLLCLSFSIFGMPFNLLKGGEFVMQTVISDIRIFVNVFLGYFIVMEICKSRFSVQVYFNSFIIIILVQCLTTIISSYSLSSQKTLYSFFGGTEAFFISLVFLFLLMSLSINTQIKSLFSNKTFLLFCMFIILLYLFVAASRGRILGLGLAVFAYLIYEKKFSYVFIMPILILLVVQIVNFINPNFINYFLWKFTTFNPLGEGGESSRIRYISFLNIVSEQAVNPYYFFVGKGLGGYFEAKYFSFENLLGDGSFNKAWIYEGKFYKPHGLLLYSLLKYGMVMTVVIFYALFRYALRSLVFLKRNFKYLNRACRLDYIILVTMSISLPYIYLVMFSSKLQLMFGLILGFMAVVTKNIKQYLKESHG